MEERRQYGFRARPNYGQVLGYIQEGEPIGLELPKRNASVYMPAAQLLLGQQQRLRRRGPRTGAAHGRLRRAAAANLRQPAKGVGHPGGGDRHSGPGAGRQAVR